MCYTESDVKQIFDELYGMLKDLDSAFESRLTPKEKYNFTFKDE